MRISVLEGWCSCESMGMCRSRGIQRRAEEGNSHMEGGGCMATKRELEERVLELENAIEQITSISDQTLDSDSEEEEDGDEDDE